MDETKLGTGHLAADLTEECQRLASRAQAQGYRVMHSDAGTLGQRASQYVEVRKAAHTVCSSARAAVAPEDTTVLLSQIEAAEKQWKALPTKASAGDVPDPGSN
jgi:hypothetical protein